MKWAPLAAAFFLFNSGVSASDSPLENLEQMTSFTKAEQVILIPHKDGNECAVASEEAPNASAILPVSQTYKALKNLEVQIGDSKVKIHSGSTFACLVQ